MELKKMFSGEKGKKILIVCAAAVLIILLISSLPRGTKTAEKPVAETENITEAERVLEKRLEELISRIDGVGAVSVMVTLDRSSQRLYVADGKNTTSVKTEENGGTETNAHETETVLVGSAKEPLYSGTVQPKVRGAAVVCSGAVDPTVREKVTNAVAKALNIGTSRVYVTN